MQSKSRLEKKALKKYAKYMASKKGQIIGGQFQSLLVIVLFFVVSGLLAVFSLDIVEDTRADLTVNGTAYNASLDAEAGIAKIPEKMPTMGSVAVAVIIISLLFAGFGGFLLARRFG